MTTEINRKGSDMGKSLEKSAISALTQMVLAFGDCVLADDKPKAAALDAAYRVINKSLQEGANKRAAADEKERRRGMREFCSKNLDKDVTVSMRNNSVISGVLRNYWPGAGSTFYIATDEPCPLTGMYVRPLYFPDIVSITHEPGARTREALLRTLKEYEGRIITVVYSGDHGVIKGIIRPYGQGEWSIGVKTMHSRADRMNDTETVWHPIELDDVQYLRIG